MPEQRLQGNDVPVGSQELGHESDGRYGVRTDRLRCQRTAQPADELEETGLGERLASRSGAFCYEDRGARLPALLREVTATTPLGLTLEVDARLIVALTGHCCTEAPSDVGRTRLRPAPARLPITGCYCDVKSLEGLSGGTRPRPDLLSHQQ